MTTEILVQIISFVFTVGIVWGVLKTNVSNITLSVTEIKETLKNFGERIGGAEKEIAILKDRNGRKKK